MGENNSQGDLVCFRAKILMKFLVEDKRRPAEGKDLAVWLADTVQGRMEKHTARISRQF